VSLCPSQVDHDRVVATLNEERSRALQVIAILCSAGVTQLEVVFPFRRRLTLNTTVRVRGPMRSQPRIELRSQPRNQPRNKLRSQLHNQPHNQPRH
jgi:hypothetical protein